MQSFRVCSKQMQLWFGSTYQSCQAYTKSNQIFRNTPKASEYFIKENSKTEERVMAIEGAL
jgi:hypothetical protein